MQEFPRDDDQPTTAVWKEGFLRVLASGDVWALRYFKMKSTLELIYFRDYCAGQTDEKLASFIDLRQVDRVELFTKMTGPSPEYGFKLKSCTGATLVSCLLPEAVTPFSFGAASTTIEVADCHVENSQKEERDDWARLLVKISGNNADLDVLQQGYSQKVLAKQGSGWWRSPANSPSQETRNLAAQAQAPLPTIQAVMGASRPLEPEDLVVDEFNSLPDVVNPIEKIVVVLVRRLGAGSGMGLFIDKTSHAPTMSVWVAGFTPNSPAGEAIPRLCRGDTILDINERSVAEMDSDEVSQLLQGDVVRLTLFRRIQKDGSGEGETFEAKHHVAKGAGVTEGELFDMEQQLVVLTAKREEMVMAQVCMDLDLMNPAERQDCMASMAKQFASMDRHEHGCVSHTNFATVMEQFGLQPEELDLLFGHYDRHDTMHFYFRDFLAALQQVIDSHHVAGLVDLSMLSSADNRGLQAQPKEPTSRCVLVECYLPQHALGGADKSAGGNRYDSVFIANGVIHAGMSCQVVRYVPAEHDVFFKAMKQFDVMIVRCAPGQIDSIGGSQINFDKALRGLCTGGVKVHSSPALTATLGTKDALTKIKKMPIGLSDTYTYASAEEFSAGFRKTIASAPRVIKQNVGMAGRGVWVAKLKSANYQPGATAADEEVLELVEASDNHVEVHTVAEFIEYCTNGRTKKAGTWTTAGTGKFFAGGKAAGGVLVDQRFCARIAEGELRVSLVANAPVAMAHMMPQAGSISALRTAGSIVTKCDIFDPKFGLLVETLTKRDLPALMVELGVPGEPLPLWWTIDFVNTAAPGAPDAWVVIDFNATCAGIYPALAANATPENPNAHFEDVQGEDLNKATAIANMVGEKVRTLMDTSKGEAGAEIKEQAGRRAPLEDMSGPLLVKGKGMVGGKTWQIRWVHISAQDGHCYLHFCKSREETEHAKMKIAIDEVKSIITSPNSHPSAPHCYKLKTYEGVTVVTIGSKNKQEMDEWNRCLQHVVHMKHHEGVRHSVTRRRATRPGDPGHESHFMTHDGSHLGLLRRGHFTKFVVELDRRSKGRGDTLKELGLQLDSAVRVWHVLCWCRVF
jgi:hypothetical protein